MRVKLLADPAFPLCIQHKEVGGMRNDPRPHKIREFQNHHSDATIWNDFELAIMTSLSQPMPRQEQPGYNRLFRSCCLMVKQVSRWQRGHPS